eukprot:7442720-Pyramimonas_sp.AAC.1
MRGASHPVESQRAEEPIRCLDVKSAGHVHTRLLILILDRLLADVREDAEVVPKGMYRTTSHDRPLIKGTRGEQWERVGSWTQ